MTSLQGSGSLNETILAHLPLVGFFIGVWEDVRGDNIDPSSWFWSGDDDDKA